MKIFYIYIYTIILFIDHVIELIKTKTIIGVTKEYKRNIANSILEYKLLKRKKVAKSFYYMEGIILYIIIIFTKVYFYLVI